MGFLIRTIFWFSLVLLVLPLSPQDSDGNSEAVGAFEAINAAREAVGDLSGMCERRPEVCETGRAAFHSIGIRAREGARIAYEFLDTQVEEPDETITTGGVPAE